MTDLRPLFALLVALAVSVGLNADRAYAQSDDERALTHFRVAQDYYEDERFEDALTEFQEAYRLSPRPALLYNIGLCHDRLGQWAEARDRYQRFLDEAPDDEHTAAARERLDRAERRAGATESGEGRVMVASANDESANDPDANDEAMDGAATPNDDDDGPTPARVWVDRILVEVGLASAVVSLATGIRAHRIHNDLEEACPGNVCSPERESRIDKGQRLARASTALTFIAAAAGITGLVVLLTGGSDEDRSDRPQLSIAPTRGGAYAAGAIAF